MPCNVVRIGRAISAGLAMAGLSAADLHAAVAPQYERLRQFGFAMSAGDEAAAKLTPHGLIDRIERADDGTFQFWAKRCFVPITLERIAAVQSPPLIGAPTNYRVTVGDVRCE